MFVFLQINQNVAPRRSVGGCSDRFGRDVNVRENVCAVKPPFAVGDAVGAQQFAGFERNRFQNGCALGVVVADDADAVDKRFVAFALDIVNDFHALFVRVGRGQFDD